MDSYSMNPQDGPYSQQSQRHQWPPHLLPHANQPPFPSPPPSDHGQHYPPFYQQQPPPPDRGPQGPGTPGDALNRTSSSLSLNLSSLSVASPANLSPITGPQPTSQALSPATPISPANNPFHPHSHAAQHHHIQSPFQFDPSQSSSGQQSPSHYDDHGPVLSGPPPGSSAGSFDHRRTPGPPRTPSSSTSQLPRKRSFTPNAPSPVGVTLVEENMYDDPRDAAMDMASTGSYDDLDMRTAYGGNTGGGSPVDGSGSTSGAEDSFGGGGVVGNHSGLGGIAMSVGVGGTMNVLGKPMATNNFVTKLYQMINDPKSAHFIAWTELGTSFVVSNVGEFSRSILGSHFKHNNFSSFVRQLNMYGFHKINRTPRAQRTSTDAQTWEFSHHKFLRGRPDLLDEIKRKALEPDPAIKQRVELPGEVAAQLGAMRDENRRMWEQLSAEKRRSEKVIAVLNKLWDLVSKGFPGSVPLFPTDLLTDESPNIYITSPSANTSRYPPLSMNLSTQSLHSIHSVNSTNSSPTTADFPAHVHNSHPRHTLSRQHSFQQQVSFSRGDSASSTPLQASPGSITMELFDDGGGGIEPPTGRTSAKRQRLSTDDGMNGIGGNGANGDSISLISSVSSPGSGSGPGLGGIVVPQKRSSRARSDSAPLGYGFGGFSHWQQGGGLSGRPRSGSGMGPRVPNIGNTTRQGQPF